MAESEAAPVGFSFSATPPAAAAAVTEDAAAAGVPEKKKTETTTKEEESTAQFTPVVQLDEVDVQSGEEEEEIIYCQRGKLFIYGETLLDVGSGNKQWNERGIGDIRILKHREHNGMRVLMRQEKTMKVIVNHALDPRIKLEPNVGSDRSWVWSAFDFATGELVETVFAIRFADSDIAISFKKIFEENQTEMEKTLAGEDSAPSAEADEAAEALAGLSTKEEGEGDSAAAAAADGADDAAGEVAKEE